MSASGGELLANISNAIVGIFRESYGRGPTKAKTYLVDNYVLTVLEDLLTPVERTLVDRGRGDLVREVRITFQTACAEKFTLAVEELTERKVLSYQSQIAFDPDIGFEVFVLEN